MTAVLLAEPPRVPDPANPDRPYPWPGGPVPSLSVHPEPTPVPIPPPNPGQPDSPVRVALRIGHAPRLPRRVRIARVLNLLGGYALGWGFTAWACYWLADVHAFIPLLVFAAILANPWRPKTSSPRVVDAAHAVGRGEGAGTNPGPGAPPLRRPVAPPIRARAA